MIRNYLRIEYHAAAYESRISARRDRAFVDEAHTSYRCFPCRFRSRTPGPPPFSSMNSTPADSRARRIARSLAIVNEVSLSLSSARRTVATLRADTSASSSAFKTLLGAPPVVRSNV